MNKSKGNDILRSNKAITLMALVVTIILLLILAGISINGLIGENGIITKTSDVKVETRGTSVEEAKNLWKLDQELNQYTNNKNAQTLEQLLDELESKKLLTEEERELIEKTGEVTIGSKNIVFDETKANKMTEKKWEAILADANKNPEKYIHPDQSSTNKDIAIGTDGKPVNLDLWKYVELEQKKIALMDIESFGSGGGATAPAYIGEITEDGKIEGTIPQYIKINGMDEFCPVKGLFSTFMSYENLRDVIIPDSIISMQATFFGCTNLVEVIIPDAVEVMGNWVFAGCTSLENITIPNSVKEISDYAFAGCTSLENIIIPNSVEEMGDNVFYSWTKDQTINIKTYTSEPSNWSSLWKSGCEATINWAQ